MGPSKTSKQRPKNVQKTSILGKIVEFLYQIMQFACDCLGQQRERKASKKVLLLIQSSSPSQSIIIHR
jgi:hypothetical protein